MMRTTEESLLNTLATHQDMAAFSRLCKRVTVWAIVLSIVFASLFIALG